MGHHSIRVTTGELMKQMKLALIGYGKMGKMVEAAAKQKGHAIVSYCHRDVTPSHLKEADLCIDFTHPSAAIPNLQIAAKQRKNYVMGTTGWYDALEEVRQIVSQHEIGFLYSPNFSIGVQLFLKIVSEAAALINEFPVYDVGITEEHHNKKVDSPSGTALAITNTLLVQMKNKSEEQLQVASLRCGSIPGTHTVHFDSPCDTITIKHQARNREGFAQGAVVAAEWLHGKKGFYTLADLLGEGI